MALPERVPYLDPQQIESAENIISGKDLAPEEIRDVLKAQGFEEPIVEHVTHANMISTIKYKAAVVKAWNS